MSRNTTSVNKIQEIVLKLKRATLAMCSKAGTGHINSSFSIAEILVTLYYGGILNVRPKEPEWRKRDRFILSKGQASPILYCLLADLGFFPESWCGEFNAPDAHFAVHLQNTVPGVELSTGSLGHGLGVASGIALGLKLKRELPLVWCLMGDAECYEGSVWEAATVASHNYLNNLVAIIDRNSLGATDFTEDMCSLEPLSKKWEAFGWNVVRMNGHNIGELLLNFGNMRRRMNRQPTMFICDTVKGNGIEFMENAPLWHARTPSGEQFDKAMKELGGWVK